MHVELPKAKKWKDFSTEYLMIVVSIITALGLEHAVQTYHHRHQAQEASERIEAELRADLKEVESALKHNEDMRKRIAKLRVALRDEIKRGTPDKAAVEHVLAMDPKGIQLAVHGPALRQEAWEVAVANQAAGFIEPAKLERYATLYAHMRDINALANGSGNRFYDGPQLVAAFADLELGTVSARALLHTLQQIEWTYAGADGNLQSLRDDLAETTVGARTETTAQR
jgi:hypothetical protein